MFRIYKDGQVIGEISDYYAFTHSNGDYLMRCENKLLRIAEVCGVKELVDTVQMYNKKFLAYISIRDGVNKKGDPMQFNEFANGDLRKRILPLSTGQPIPASLTTAPVPPTEKKAAPKYSRKKATPEPADEPPTVNTVDTEDVPF
jgi:hypothetical protein